MTADLFGNEQYPGLDAPMHLPVRGEALLRLGRYLQNENYRFVTVTPTTHQRVLARMEKQWADNISDILGWSLPFMHHAIPQHLFSLMHEAGMLIPYEDGWRSTLRASTLHQQLFFHSAFPTDEADTVFFGPDTYRFIRALNLELNSLASSVRRAADIGCGAGPGAINIALACPQAEVFAIDINESALRMTEANARLAATSNVRAINSNLFAAVEGNFDLIIANPPYLLDAEERTYRHGGGDLGSGLSLAIVDAALTRLAPGGTLLLYTGVVIVDGKDRFLQTIKRMLEENRFDWTYEELDVDVFGEELDQPAYGKADRIAAIWLKAVRPDF